MNLEEFALLKARMNRDCDKGMNYRANVGGLLAIISSLAGLTEPVPEPAPEPSAEEATVTEVGQDDDTLVPDEE